MGASPRNTTLKNADVARRVQLDKMAANSPWLAEWLTLGWRGFAALLRTTAGALQDLADWIEKPVRGENSRTDDDSPPPLEGTRARIAETLDRARNRYESARDRAPRTGKPPVG
jgi:hypothetical protein